MSARAGKRPMRSLSAHEKLEAIRRVHEGESKASVARDIGVPESTLRGWCKNEDKISYLSRQSSPETDESMESQTKKPRIEVEPFNLSMKNGNKTNFSPNSEARFAPSEPIKTEQDPARVPLNLNIKSETPKTTSIDHSTDRERNKAELARMSIELGLNRPEMFISSLQSTSNLSDLNASISLLAHWNTLLFQQQQQKMQQATKSKVTTTTDSIPRATSSQGLLSTVDQKHLSKEQQSLNDSIWFWLRNQKKGINPAALPLIPHTNGVSTAPTATPSRMVTTNTTTQVTNGEQQVPSFWSWYKEDISQQYPTADKPILYQRLTKEATQQETSSQQDQHNAENLSLHKSAHNKTINNNKARSVLDNLLFNNNNNVAVNTKTDNAKAEEESVSQREAVEHGEKFLRWLETCSDPSVTAVQIMQFRCLLNNVRSVAERKNGELQNKTKVKRK